MGLEIMGSNKWVQIDFNLLDAQLALNRRKLMLI